MMYTSVKMIYKILAHCVICSRVVAFVLTSNTRGSANVYFQINLPLDQYIYIYIYFVQRRLFLKLCFRRERPIAFILLLQPIDFLLVDSAKVRITQLNHIPIHSILIDKE
jgi:hypothetical protein